jgi:hypothetical protein
VTQVAAAPAAPASAPSVAQAAQPASAGTAASPTPAAAGPQVASQAPARPSAVQTVAATPDGATVTIQNVGAGQLTNIVVNSANGRTIVQNTAVNLVLPGFSAAQRAQVLSAMGMKMGSDASFGIVSAIHH